MGRLQGFGCQGKVVIHQFQIAGSSKKLWTLIETRLADMYVLTLSNASDQRQY